MMVGKGIALIAAATVVVFFGGMAAMMTWVMASGAPWHGMSHGTMHGMMHGWGGSTAPQTPVVSQSQEFTVEMRDFTFRPNDLTVPAGTRVTWVNRDAAPHDATDDDGAWSTQLLSGGDEAALTFDTPGTFSYYCTVHPQMRGTLTVS